MRPKSDTLTGQELEIMKVIWPRGQATIREVYDELRAHRAIAITVCQNRSECRGMRIRNAHAATKPTVTSAPS